MTASISNGILTPGIANLPVFCSTGNCTWPIIPTLAVCGACTTETYATSCNSTNCNYTLPDRTVATASALQEDGNALLFTVLSSEGKIYNASSPTTPYIANFDVIGAPWTSEVWTNITASECALWFCVQAYNISVENSRQSQSLVKSWSTIADTEPFDGISNRTFIDIPADFNVSPNTTFYVGGESVRAIKEALPQYLEGTVLNGDGYQYSSNYIEALWNASSNMDALVSNLALSITNGMILQQPALSSAPYYSTRYRYLSFVHVR
jgi:hypothetical protein